MKDATKERVEKETADWQYMAELPNELHGFKLERLMEIDGDVYELFRYSSAEKHRSATAYFHEETKEYKLRVKIGLVEFCKMEYITGSFDTFELLLKTQLEGMLESLSRFDEADIGSILRSKKIMEWEYGRRLPASLEGFQLFIAPAEPVEITNGSYIIIDYTDFALETSFNIYYNMFRDEYFGEARIHNIPDVNYVFDSKELDELEKKLQEHLVPRLREIRQRAQQVK